MLEATPPPTPEKREDVEGLIELARKAAAPEMPEQFEHGGEAKEWRAAYGAAELARRALFERLDQPTVLALLEELRQAQEGWSKVGKIAEERSQLAQDALERVRAAEARALKLEAQRKALMAAASEAEGQIAYFHEKFAETGSGNAVLAQIRAAISLSEDGAHLSEDVIRLVIAARRVAYESQQPEALHELDESVEAFADRVPWEDEPAPPTTKGEEE